MKSTVALPVMAGPHKPLVVGSNPSAATTSWQVPTQDNLLSTSYLSRWRTQPREPDYYGRKVNLIDDR